MIQVTYKKRNGNIIHKYRKTMIPYAIGDTTSMGWKVLNVKYEYNDEYYPEYQYYILIEKNKERFIRKKQMIELFMKELKTFLYYFIAIMILYYIKIRIGI